MTCETLDTNLDTIYLNEESEQDSCLVLCIEERDVLDDYDNLNYKTLKIFETINALFPNIKGIKAAGPNVNEVTIAVFNFAFSKFSAEMAAW